MPKVASKSGIREIVLADGSLRYEARVHRRGQPAKAKRFQTLTEARRWKRAIDARVDEGKPILNRKGVFISSIIDDYLKHRAKSLKPLASNQITDYLRVKEDFADWSISRLTNRVIEQYIINLMTEPILRDATKKSSDGCAKTYRPATIRKFYYALKKAVEWHSKTYNYHIDEHLFALEKGSIPDGWSGKRERRLTKSEEECLYAAGIDRENTFSERDWRSIIGFALETAMREQEIVLARWSDLSGDWRKLRIPKEHSKTRASRVVLLSARARELVADQRARCPEEEARIFFQFPHPQSVCVAFARLCRRAKVEDLRFHDLRHEATSRLCESGKLNMMHIMEMTGHRSMATFQGYLHLLSHETSVVLD